MKAPGDPILMLTVLKEGRPHRRIKLVRSHTFYWRPRRRKGPDPMYLWGVWWLRFYLGSERVTRGERDA